VQQVDSQLRVLTSYSTAAQVSVPRSAPLKRSNFGECARVLDHEQDVQVDATMVLPMRASSYSDSFLAGIVTHGYRWFEFGLASECLIRSPVYVLPIIIPELTCLASKLDNQLGALPRALSV